MPVKRQASFGTYFLVGTIGMLIGSVIGKTLLIILKTRKGEVIYDIINLGGIAYQFFIQAGYTFTFNLIAVIGILLAIYIYRRI